MPPKQPNPLLDLLLTVILPSAALEWLSKPERLGPFGALVVASALPIGYGLYCWFTKSGLNFLSVFGLIAIVLTGGLGLMELDAFWFGVKEASVPIIMGVLFPISHLWKKPLIESILLAPHVMNERSIRRALDTPEKQAGFNALLWRASLAFGGTTLLSAVVNFLLAMHYIGPTKPGTEEYAQAIGKQNWMGYLVIGLPLMVVMMAIFFRFMRGLQQVTGLDQTELMVGGRTVVKRQ
jgi:intracellular septation protein A